jgi:uncharacterized protein (TIGR03382 family)
VSYRAPRGARVHVILGAAEIDGKATVTAKRDGDGCAVSVAGGGDLAGRPAIVALDDACTVTPDPPSPNAAPAAGTRPARPASGGGSRSQRSGCCGAQAGPEAPLSAAAVVGLVLLRRRRGARVSSTS